MSKDSKSAVITFDLGGLIVPVVIPFDEAISVGIAYESDAKMHKAKAYVESKSIVSQTLIRTMTKLKRKL